jgi:flagellar biogenesis protein FliO
VRIEVEEAGSSRSDAEPLNSEDGFIHVLLLLLIVLAIIALSIWILQQLT